MPILSALNDKAFLERLIQMARDYSRTQEARILAAKLGSIENLVAYIRAAPFRPDLGDPDDGPRIGDLISQRVRLDAIDPNCVERTVKFLGLALLLAPKKLFSAATVMIDEGLHTFPVELTATSVRPIILDSTALPLRNLMTAAVYDITDMSPLTDDHIVPWFANLARNATSARGMIDCYKIATSALTRAITTGTGIEEPLEVACLIQLASEDAPLFGPLGELAFQRMESSLRNLSLSLESKAVGKYLDRLMDTVEPIAGDVLKAALIAKFGPAAGLALHDRNIAVREMQKKAKKAAKDASAVGTAQADGRKAKPSKEELRQRVSRLSPAYMLHRKQQEK